MNRTALIKRGDPVRDAFSKLIDACCELSETICEDYEHDEWEAASWEETRRDISLHVAMWTACDELSLSNRSAQDTDDLRRNLTQLVNRVCRSMGVE